MKKYLNKANQLIHSFNLTEKVIFFFFVGVLCVSSISLLYQVNKLFTVEVPDYGGTLTEGVIGTPRFVNPLLSVSDIDRDLTALVYSGLLRNTPDDSLIPDLAKSCDVSSALVYTCTLKTTYFQDGVKVTTDDVLFTVSLASDPNFDSPRALNWNGVKTEKIDDMTVRFTLKQPYAPFMQNLTLGILPKHIWKSVSAEEFPFSEYNVKPVGTGPYKVQTVSYASNGLPNQYTLVANKKFALGEPYITHIILKSYQTEKDLVDAYKSGDISSMYGISGNDAKILKLSHIILSPLPRVFGVFFNQNLAPVLVNKEVRQALNTATNKQAIVDNILGGYGQVLNSPIPENTSTVASTTNNSDLILKAQNILTKAGWTKNLDGIFQKKDKKNNVTTLSFSISTGDAPELKETAYLIQKEWQAMGANVSVKIFETSDLNQNIIRPRKYDALLFGEVVGRNTDLYPFWHSSQRQSPGLNIALYANVKADKILENLRKNSDPSLYNQLNKEIINDVPAVFTYSPYFIYVLPNSVHGVNLGTLNTPSDRLSDIYRWYIEINNVWKIFLNKK